MNILINWASIDCMACYSYRAEQMIRHITLKETRAVHLHHNRLLHISVVTLLGGEVTLLNVFIILCHLCPQTGSMNCWGFTRLLIWLYSCSHSGMDSLHLYSHVCAICFMACINCSQTGISGRCKTWIGYNMLIVCLLLCNSTRYSIVKFCTTAVVFFLCTQFLWS